MFQLKCISNLDGLILCLNIEISISSKRICNSNCSFPLPKCVSGNYSTFRNHRSVAICRKVISSILFRNVHLRWVFKIYTLKRSEPSFESHLYFKKDIYRLSHIDDYKFHISHRFSYSPNIQKLQYYLLNTFHRPKSNHSTHNRAHASHFFFEQAKSHFYPQR